MDLCEALWPYSVSGSYFALPPIFFLSLYNHFMLMWALKFRLRYIPEYWIKFALKSQFSQIKINVQICYINFWTLYHYFWMQFTWVGGLIDTITCTTLNLFVVIKFCCLDMELKSRKQRDFYYIHFFDLALLKFLNLYFFVSNFLINKPFNILLF